VAHVWIWRQSDNTVEILLQKRSDQSKTWPGFWDISTAGHIDAGETPLATAVREASEEIGITIDPNELSLVGVYRWKQKAVSKYDVIENELQWIYTYEMRDTHDNSFIYEESEVSGTRWTTMDEFTQLTQGESRLGPIVDHDKEYYAALLRHIGALALS